MDLETEKRLRKKRSQRKIYVNVMTIFSFIIMFVGMGITIAYYKQWGRIMLLLVLGVSMVIGFAIFNSVNMERMEYKMEDQYVQYTIADLSVLRNMSAKNVKRILLMRKFKNIGNDFYGKKVSRIRNVYYHAKCVETEDFVSAIEQELPCIVRMANQEENSCTWLFIYKKQITEEDLSTLVNWNKSIFITETVLPTYSTIVTVLIDSDSNNGYFLEMKKKWHIALYYWGCKMLKKYFAKEN